MVMLGEVRKLCLVFATLAAGCAAVGASCEHGRTWWSRGQGACLPCTRCEPQGLAVKFPCELHRDTICQAFHEITWPFGDRTTGDTRGETDYYEDVMYPDYGEVSDDDAEVPLSVQTVTLTLAVCGCVVFFVVVVYLTLYHSKQWRVLKQALKSDVEDLSAKLKLMEAGETPAEPVVATDHHIYCNVHVTKDALLGPSSNKKGLGNVYTQEKQPT